MIMAVHSVDVSNAPLSTIRKRTLSKEGLDSKSLEIGNLSTLIQRVSREKVHNELA